jgi:putative hydrolase of the HAD superfamily
MTVRPRAILFDLDETILTFGRRLDQLASVAQDFARGGLVTAETLADAVDRHMSAFWADAARREDWRARPAEAMRMVVAGAFAEVAAVGAAPHLDRDAAHRFADAFRLLRTAQIRPFAGAIETLDALRATGVRMALVTNGPADIQRAKIDRFDLARRFDHVQVEGECGFGKPEARAYRHALEALDAAPAEAWMVGDNLEWEVAAPQKLGLYAVWCDPYEVGLPAGATARPDRIIRSLTELHPLA